MKNNYEKQLVEMINQGNAQILTIDIARKLKGSKIAACYIGYANQNGYLEFIVGDIATKYELNKKNIDAQAAVNGKKYLKDAQNTYCLLNSAGENTYFFCDKNYSYYAETGVFCCSDLDRFVYFMVIE